ncbi:dihydrofolate reductase [Bacillus thuringiensis]|uniref:dihydrofolate reductase n=1 Tax=Bacillus thuringiensis TaxID=1428 RepID=UPI00125EB02E|nr:dihydrofolate reductase [Bacillus thuringiensis]KAB5632707.1 dihydrofolate reductase [Bacillus thuringiensis]HDR5269075.1 dihydrofolate reductase [Bacillus thuringiensis]
MHIFSFDILKILKKVYITLKYITKIHATFEGDRYFPEIDISLWKERYTEKGNQNDKNPYEYYFHAFKKNKISL